VSSIIEDIIARKIFNSRGEETIEVDVITASGFGRAAAPAGKSRGKAEVMYYPQGGVDAALKKVDELIAPELAGLNADFQEEIDSTLHEVDGTTNFKVIGGNTAFAVSLANAEAAANSHGMLLFQFLGGSAASTLPYPLGNTISGGQHARGKAPDIQEFLALPHGAETFLEAATANALIHKKIGDALKKSQAHRAHHGAESEEDGELPVPRVSRQAGARQQEHSRQNHQPDHKTYAAPFHKLFRPYHLRGPGLNRAGLSVGHAAMAIPAPPVYADA
jgi:enolase